MGGEVVPPKPPKKVCGGCGAAIAGLSLEFGMTDNDIIGPWRRFVEAAAKATPDGKKLLKAFASADDYVPESIRNNPASLGDVTMAFVTGAEFAELVLSKPGASFDRLKLPKVTQRFFQRAIKGLRKGLTKKRDRKDLDALERELKKWSRKTVAEIRDRFMRR